MSQMKEAVATIRELVDALQRAANEVHYLCDHGLTIADCYSTVCHTSAAAIAAGRELLRQMEEPK
jgi:hypothetical protein